MKELSLDQGAGLPFSNILVDVRLLFAISCLSRVRPCGGELSEMLCLVKGYVVWNSVGGVSNMTLDNKKDLTRLPTTI